MLTYEYIKCPDCLRIINTLFANLIENEKARTFLAKNLILKCKKCNEIDKTKKTKKHTAHSLPELMRFQEGLR